jgi:flagellar hook protein FlgE
MLDSVNVAFSGLTAFSDGLRNISTNVANMNSTGFKGTALQFSDLFYKMDLTVNGQTAPSTFSQGSGVGISYQGTDFSQGEETTTDSTTDLAINGNGFFILRQDNGTQTYTRNGHFDFDANGYLVDPASGARVAGMTAAGQLTDINIADLARSPAKATSQINLSGTLNRADTTGTTTTLTDGVNVIDPSGSLTHVNVVATKVDDVTPGDPSWTVQVTNDAGSVLLSGGAIRFQGDGSLQDGFNTVSFVVTPAGGAPQTVSLNFGTAGSLSGGVVAFTTSSAALSVGSQDGFAMGEVTKRTFDTSGALTLTYSNGQTVVDKKVALAQFNDMQALTPVSGAQFINSSNQTPVFGTAGTNGFGAIQGSSLEASNVNLAAEFSQLVIIQRGYQSASQVLSAANDMAQQLIELFKK